MYSKLNIEHHIIKFNCILHIILLLLWNCCNDCSIPFLQMMLLNAGLIPKDHTLYTGRLLLKIIFCHTSNTFIFFLAILILIDLMAP